MSHNRRYVYLGNAETEAFWAQVVRGPKCWLWTGPQSGGRTGGRYGKYSGQWAHRYAYEFAHGPIPIGQQVMHLCHNSLCVRPSHLRVGTALENVRASAELGHYRVARPRRQKLSAEQIQSIRSRVAAGERQSRVAADFGITTAFVSLIMSGRRRQYDALLEA